ncbi:hypothetical protein [Flavobacterium ardleyense]|nr:hypothetical protein [Flavobacterium ardleyense]
MRSFLRQDDKFDGELRDHDNGTVANLRYPARFFWNLVGIT